MGLLWIALMAAEGALLGVVLAAHQLDTLKGMGVHVGRTGAALGYFLGGALGAAAGAHMAVSLGRGPDEEPDPASREDRARAFLGG